MLPIVKWNDDSRKKYLQAKRERKEYLKGANISHDNRAERLEKFLEDVYPEVLKEFNKEEEKRV